MVSSKLKILGLLNFFFLILAFDYVHATDIKLDQALGHSILNVRRNHEILDRIPETDRKGKVGVVLLYEKDNYLYALLGREKLDDDKPRTSERFCDLGGALSPKNHTYLENMLRELKEESVGLFDIEPDNFSNNCITIVNNELEREVIYSLYTINEAQYIGSSVFKDKINNTQYFLSKEYLEKDQFLWLDIKLLLQELQHYELDGLIKVTDIDANQHMIKLRTVFVNGCLKCPDFKKIIDYQLTLIEQKLFQNIAYLFECNVYGRHTMTHM